MPAPAPPNVSVCLPAYNTERSIVRSIESALCQTYVDLEVVVVDDASTDRTLQRVKQLDDPRIRLFANSNNLGEVRNANRSVSLARGRLIKFLHSDDLMYPDCVETLADLFERHAGLGLAFSLRDIDAEEPNDLATDQWRAKYLQAHTIFGDLREANDGKALARRWLQHGLGINAVGEPTNVMVMRDCLERVGTFGVRLRQRSDMDLWLRAMLFYDVGFIGRPLSRYVIRRGSVTSINRTSGLGWMDSLWLAEGLLTFDAVRVGWPEVRVVRRRAAKRCVKHAMSCALAGDWSKARALFDYVGFHLRGGESARLFGTLDDRGPPGETVREPTRALT